MLVALLAMLDRMAECVLCITGLHGAAVAITGRRQPVLDSAVEAFSSEGINAIGIQVMHCSAASSNLLIYSATWMLLQTHVCT